MNVNRAFKFVYLGIGLVALYRAVEQAQAGAFGWGTLNLAVAIFCAYRFYATGRITYK